MNTGGEISALISQRSLEFTQLKNIKLSLFSLGISNNEFSKEIQDVLTYDNFENSFYILQNIQHFTSRQTMIEC